VPCTVREFLEYAFGHVELDWERHVRFDDRYLRPTEVDALLGDPTKTQKTIGWAATTLAPALAALMVDNDVNSIRVR
jgi:GDPmannose 4,6-dehydratase